MNRSITKWDPIKELNQVGQRLSSLFSGKDDSDDDIPSLQNTEWTPAIDISEDKNEYLIVADLPEVEKEEVKVEIDNGVLSISGERKSKSEEKDEKRKFHRIERSSGIYLRTFRLPENVRENAVDAEFKNGVLRVHLPKCETSPGKNIKIN